MIWIFIDVQLEMILKLPGRPPALMRISIKHEGYKFCFLWHVEIFMNNYTSTFLLGIQQQLFKTTLLKPVILQFKKSFC